MASKKTDAFSMDGTIFSMLPRERAVILDLARSRKLRNRMDVIRLALHQSGVLSKKQAEDILQPRVQP
jgi:hypothetical protein